MAQKLTQISLEAPTTGTRLYGVNEGLTHKSHYLIDAWDQIRLGGDFPSAFSGLFEVSGSGYLDYDLIVKRNSLMGTYLEDSHNFVGSINHSGYQFVSSGVGLFQSGLATSGQFRAYAPLNTNHEFIGNTYVSGSGIFEDYLQSATFTSLGDSSLYGDVTLGNDSASVHSVNGQIYFNDAVYFNDDVNYETVARFQQEVEVQDNLYISGVTSGVGNAIFGTNINNRVDTRGPVYVGERLWVEDDAFITGNLNVKGNSVVSGTLRAVSSLVAARGLFSNWKIDNFPNTIENTNPQAAMIVGDNNNFWLNIDTNTLFFIDLDLTCFNSPGRYFLNENPSILGRASGPSTSYNQVYGDVFHVASDTNITGKVVITGDNNLYVDGQVFSNQTKYATISGYGHGTTTAGDAIIPLEIVGMTGTWDGTNTTVFTHAPGHPLLVGDYLDINNITVPNNNSPTRGFSSTIFEGAWEVVTVGSPNAAHLHFICRGQNLTSATYNNGNGVANSFLRTIGKSSRGIRGAYYVNKGKYRLQFDPPFSDENYFVTLTCANADEHPAKFGLIDNSDSNMVANVHWDGLSGGYLGITCKRSNNAAGNYSDGSILFVKCEYLS